MCVIILVVILRVAVVKYPPQTSLARPPGNFDAHIAIIIYTPSIILPAERFTIKVMGNLYWIYMDNVFKMAGVSAKGPSELGTFDGIFDRRHLSYRD